MNPSTSKKRGRPASGNITFKCRCRPEQVQKLRAVLEGWEPSEPKVGVAPKVDDNVKALLSDVERLTQERDEWESRYLEAMDNPLDAVGAHWKELALKFKKRVAELEGML